MTSRTISPTMLPTIQRAVFETPLPKARIRLLFRGFSGVCPLSGALGLSRGARSLDIPFEKGNARARTGWTRRREAYGLRLQEVLDFGSLDARNIPGWSTNVMCPLSGG